MWRQNRNPPAPKDFDNKGLRIKLLSAYKYQGTINIPDALALIHPSLITTPPESENEDEAPTMSARRPGFRFLPWEREEENGIQDRPDSQLPRCNIDDDLKKIMQKLLTYKISSSSRHTESTIQSRADEDDDCMEIVYPENMQIKKEIPEVILVDDDDEMPEIPVQPKVPQVAIKQEIVPEVTIQQKAPLVVHQVPAIKQEKLPEVANKNDTPAVVIKQEKPDQRAICEEPREKRAEILNEAQSLEFIKRCKLSAKVKLTPKKSEKNKAEKLIKKWSEPLIPYSDSEESAKRSGSEDSFISKILHHRRSGSSKNEEALRKKRSEQRRRHSSSDDSIRRGHRPDSSQRRKDHKGSLNGERSRRHSSDSDRQSSRYSKMYSKSVSVRRRSTDRHRSRSIERYQVRRHTSRKRHSSGESSMRHSSRHSHRSRKKTEDSARVPKRYQLQKTSRRSSDSESSSVSRHSKTSRRDRKGKRDKSPPFDSRKWVEKVISQPPANSVEELEDGEISDAESPAPIKSPVRRNASPSEGPRNRNPVRRNVSPGEDRPPTRSPAHKNVSPVKDRPPARSPIPKNVSPSEDHPPTRSPIHKNVSPSEDHSHTRSPINNNVSPGEDLPCSSPTRRSPSYSKSPAFKHSPHSRSPSPYQKLLHGNSPGFQRSNSHANSYLSEEEDRKPDMKQEFYDNCDFYCDICQLSLNSMNTFDAHMKGKRHRKAVTAMQVQDLARGGTPIDPVPLTKESVTRRGKPPPGKKWLPLNIHSRMQELIDVEESPMPGVEYVLEIRADRDTAYFCELCEAPCAPITIRPHLKGFKHQLHCLKEVAFNFYTKNKDRPKRDIERTVRRLLIDDEKKFGRKRMKIYREIDDDEPKYDQPGPSSRGPIALDMFGNNVKPELPEMNGDDLVSEVGFDGSRFDHNVYRSFTTGDIHCTLCDSHMNNTQMWEAHIQGKKHLKNHKKNPFDPRTKTKLIKSTNVRSRLLEELEYEKEENTDEAPYVVGLDYIQETQNETGEMYNCRLCNGVCTNADIFTHLYGLKHKTKYLEILERDGVQVGISTIRSIQVGKESRESLINAECVKALERFGKGHPNVVISVG